MHPARRRLHYAQLLVSSLLIPFPAVLALAQTSSTTTIKTGTSLVVVSATVHDKAGQPVPGLTRDDFILKQDGKPQDIRFFSQGSDLPLTLTLMIDTSGSQRSYVAAEIAAGRIFLHTALTQPHDRAVLVQFDGDVQQYAGLTSSVEELEFGLTRLSHRNAYTDCGDRPGGTRLTTPSLRAPKSSWAKRRAAARWSYPTDGGDEGSRSEDSEAIEAAQRADILIYSIYYSDGGGNKDVLDELSSATGGRVFTVSRTLTLQQIFLQIAGEMRLQYLARLPATRLPRQQVPHD